MKHCMIVLAAFITTAAIGCQSEEGLDTSPVSGVVTFRGAPIEGAQVTFVPTQGGMSAVGVTDAEGRYSLTTRSKDDGAVPGSYTVKITKFEGGADDVDTSPIDEAAVEDITDEYPEDYDPATAAAAEAAKPPPRNLLPPQYADPTSSGLTATVGEGEQTFDFTLEG